MENRTEKKNTFRTGNLLVSSITIVIIMVIMGFKIPAIIQESSKGIAVQNVNSIVVDNENIVWFSTDVGIVSFDGENWKLNNGNENLLLKTFKRD